MKNIKLLFNIMVIFTLCLVLESRVKAEKGINGEQFDSGIYDQVCTYYEENNEVIVQISKNLNWADSLIYKYNGKKTNGMSGSTNINHEAVDNWTPNVNKTYAKLKKQAIKDKKCTDGTCPSICPTYAMITHDWNNYKVFVAWKKETLEEKGYKNYRIIRNTGSRQATVAPNEATYDDIYGDKVESESGSDYHDESSDGEDDSTKNPINTCDDIPETMMLVKQVYNLLRYLIPVIIIGLGIVDFVKAILSDDEKLFKNAWSRLVKRLVVGVVILILPVILEFIINMSNVIDGSESGDIFCIFS